MILNVYWNAEITGAENTKVAGAENAAGDYERIGSIGMKAAFYYKILAKSILEQSFAVPWAALYYRKRLKKPGVYHLIVCDHIGDFLCAMGYARAFQAQKHIKKLRIVCTEKFRELVDMYPQLDCEYCGISKRKLELLCTANRNVLGQQLFASWNDNCVIEPADGFVQGFDYAKRYPGLHLKECICYGSFGLKENSPFDLPSYAQSACQDTDKRTGGASEAGKVLLCPDAQSVCYAQAQPLFRQLAKAFKDRGWKVFVNIKPGRKTAVRAIPIYCGFRELCEKLGQFQCVVGLRSGILDLAAFAPCGVIALYPPACGMERFFDLHDMNPAKKDIYQYQLTGDRILDTDAVLRIAALLQTAAEC